MMTWITDWRSRPRTCAADRPRTPRRWGGPDRRMSPLRSGWRQPVGGVGRVPSGSGAMHAQGVADGGGPAARPRGSAEPSSRAVARRAWDVGNSRHSEETAAIMRAQLGDQLVVESPATGVTRRDGEVVGLHHEDGTPPYDVRWSDTDEVTLVFPGPDAHIRHIEHRPGSAHEPSRPPRTGRAGSVAQGPAGPRRAYRPIPVTSAAASPPNAPAEA